MPTEQIGPNLTLNGEPGTPSNTKVLACSYSSNTFDIDALLKKIRQKSYLRRIDSFFFSDKKYKVEKVLVLNQRF